MSQNLLNDYIINQTRQLAHLNKIATHQHHQSAHRANEIGNEVTLLMSDIHHHHHNLLHRHHNNNNNNYQQQQQQQVDNTLTTQDHFAIADEMPQHSESDNSTPAEIVRTFFCFLYSQKLF